MSIRVTWAALMLSVSFKGTHGIGILLVADKVRMVIRVAGMA